MDLLDLDGVLAIILFGHEKSPFHPVLAQTRSGRGGSYGCLGKARPRSELARVLPIRHFYRAERWKPCPGSRRVGRASRLRGLSHAAFAFDAALSRPLPMATPGCGRDHHPQCPPDMLRVMMVATPSELAKGTTTLPRSGLTPSRLAAGVGKWLPPGLPRSQGTRVGKPTFGSHRPWTKRPSTSGGRSKAAAAAPPGRPPRGRPQRRRRSGRARRARRYARFRARRGRRSSSRAAPGCSCRPRSACRRGSARAVP